MRADAALRLVRQMQRYGRRGDVKQVLIPLATAAQRRQATRIADINYERETQIQWVPVSRLVSEQKCLACRGMAYQLPRFSKMQRRKRPVVMLVSGGKFFVWDGNHRCTSAILLGKTRLRCDVLSRARK